MIVAAPRCGLAVNGQSTCSIHGGRRPWSLGRAWFGIGLAVNSQSTCSIHGGRRPVSSGRTCSSSGLVATDIDHAKSPQQPRHSDSFRLRRKESRRNRKTCVCRRPDASLRSAWSGGTRPTHGERWPRPSGRVCSSSGLVATDIDLAKSPQQPRRSESVRLRRKESRRKRKTCVCRRPDASLRSAWSGSTRPTHGERWPRPSGRAWRTALA